MSTHKHVFIHIHITATDSSEVGTAHKRFPLGMAPMTELIVLRSYITVFFVNRNGSLKWSTFFHQESVEIDATEAVKHDKLTFRMPSNIIRDLKEANPNKQTKKGNSNAPERGIEVSLITSCPLTNLAIFFPSNVFLTKIVKRLKTVAK